MTTGAAWEACIWAIYLCFPGGASGKEPACQGRRRERCRLDPWLGKIPFPRRRAQQPLHYSCLENPTDRGAWWATVQGVAEELDMTEQPSTHTHTQAHTHTHRHTHTHTQTHTHRNTHRHTHRNRHRHT